MSTTSTWACGTSELPPCNRLRMLSADRFCESRMREILTSGSMRGEDVVPVGIASSPTLPPLYGRRSSHGCEAVKKSVLAGLVAAGFSPTLHFRDMPA
jgi:hypothetical protein